MKIRALLGSILFFLIICRQSPGYIHRMYSLQEVLDESTHVLVGKIKTVDRQRGTAVARIEKALKGRIEFPEINMNIGLAARDQANYLLSLLKPGDPYIIFYKNEGWRIASCAHSADTWFQLYAEGNPNRLWWRMSHLEIYFGRTFNGSSSELIRLTEGVLAGRIRPPPPDPGVPRLDYRKRPPRRDSGAGLTRILLGRSSTWKYFRGSREAPTNWRQVDFDDSRWASGKGPFGYGDPPLGTLFDDMEQGSGRSGYPTVFLRKTFQVDNPAAVTALEAAIDYDDGFILWINGRQAVSANAPVGRITHTSFSSGQHESGAFETFPVENPRLFLVRGPNLAAIQVFNCNLTSSDLKMDLELKATISKVQKGEGFHLLEQFNCVGGKNHGISWADVNGDERLDLYFCRSGSNLLLVNEGDGFADRTGGFGVAAGSSSASWADYNLDDHPDLLTDNLRLLTNQGSRFRDSSRLLASGKPRGAPARAGWIDYNGDGLPDILAATRLGFRLFENTGKGPGWFREVSSRASLGRGIGGGTPAPLTFADYDGDGYIDFFYNLGTGLLAHNQGDGTFRFQPGSGIRLPAPNHDGGATFGDFDNDGDLDLFLSSPGKARLYRNRNDGTFQDIVDSSGDLAGSTEPSSGGAWGDVNGDGFLDLFVCHTRGRSRLYLGDGKGRFRDGTEKSRLPPLSPAHAASFADIDGDNDLDLAVNLERGVQIWVNDWSPPPDRGWLKVVVQARKGLVGTVVRALDSRGKFLGMRELGGAESSGGQACPAAHFGVPLGETRISAISSDGRVAQKKVTLRPGGAEVFLRDVDFQ